MSNTLFAGQYADKLMLYSGQFTTTVKDSEDVGAVDASVDAIEYDGTNTLWTGLDADKVYLQSGLYTSTLKTSEGFSGSYVGLSGCSSTELGSGGGGDTLLVNHNTAKLLLASGQFSSTIKDSEDVSAIDNIRVGISADENDDTIWLGNNDDKLYLQSGQFTSTIKTSVYIGSRNILDCGWDGTNTIVGQQFSKAILYSGKFSSTIKTSEGGLAFNGGSAVGSDDAEGRLGAGAPASAPLTGKRRWGLGF